MKSMMLLFYIDLACGLAVDHRRRIVAIHRNEVAA